MKSLKKKKYNRRTKKKYGGTKKKKRSEDNIITKGSIAYYYNKNKSPDIKDCIILRIDPGATQEDPNASDWYTIKIGENEIQTIEKFIFKDIESAQKAKNKDLESAKKNNEINNNKSNYIENMSTKELKSFLNFLKVPIKKGTVEKQELIDLANEQKGIHSRVLELKREGNILLKHFNMLRIECGAGPLEYEEYLEMIK